MPCCDLVISLLVVLCICIILLLELITFKFGGFEIL